VEAEADASTCISIAPEFARGYCRLAKVKQKQGYSEDGIGILEQALKKLPGNGLLEDELRKMKRARENAAVKKAARQKAAKERKEKDAAYDKAKAENEANSKPETKQFERTPDGLINLRVDSAKMSKEEMVQLQTLAGQYEDVKRQHREANLLMGRFEYEKKKDVLTLQEVASLESGRNTYRSIGKSYVMQPLEKIQDQIKSDITNRESEGTTLQSRQGYLQKRLISLEGELKDLVGGINSR
jgi:prefoldin subunit 1